MDQNFLQHNKIKILFSNLSTMKTYNLHLLLLLKRLGLILCMFFLARLFFLLLNHSHFTHPGLAETLCVFIVGMRFDLSVIVYFNLLVILMHILPLGSIKNKKAYQAFIRYYMIIVNSLLILIDLADARYFDFTLKRSTAFQYYFITGSDDFLTLLPRFIADYWYIGLYWAGLLALFSYLFHRGKMQKKIRQGAGRFKIKHLLYQFPAFIILSGLLLVGARGGLQNKPLTVSNATKYTSVQSAPLALNTPFAVMTTFGHKNIEYEEYFTLEQCHEIFPVRHQYSYPDSAFRKINIVIILLESFSREYSGYLNGTKGYTPFLDSLMQHSLCFANAYATATRSIDAVHCITTGIAPLMDDPFTLSVYNTNRFASLATILKEKDYRTAFFHGGTNGTLNIDSYADMAGFDWYYGRSEYGNEDDYDGYWGIYDHAFLQYFARKLNTFKEPFFAFEFTLSSHNPYQIPPEYEEMFPEDEVKIHPVVRYTDFALQQFFKTASGMPWFNNTLFVLLADHTGHSLSAAENMRKEEEYRLTDLQLQYYKNLAGQYAIPLLFYFPGDSLAGRHDFTFQQSDIVPSILDYMNYNEAFIAFGSSAFRDGKARMAFQCAHDVYTLTQGDYTLVFDGQESVSLYNTKKDPGQKHNLIDQEKQLASEMEKYIKAALQQYNYRMINNKLFP